jgi:hypothetical protein
MISLFTQNYHLLFRCSVAQCVAARRQQRGVGGIEGFFFVALAGSSGSCSGNQRSF